MQVTVSRDVSALYVESSWFLEKFDNFFQFDSVREFLGPLAVDILSAVRKRPENDLTLKTDMDNFKTITAEEFKDDIMALRRA
jgi:hypothetical protein